MGTINCKTIFKLLTSLDESIESFKVIQKEYKSGKEISHSNFRELKIKVKETIEAIRELVPTEIHVDTL